MKAMVHAVRLGGEDKQEKRAGGEKRLAARGLGTETAHGKNGRIKDPSLSIGAKKGAATMLHVYTWTVRPMKRHGGIYETMGPSELGCPHPSRR